MEFTSATHKAILDSRGLLKVYALEKPALRKTTFLPDGSVRTDIETADTATGAERDLLAAMSRMPWFAATWSHEDRAWRCDVDCGFQRWNGQKPGVVIGKALSRAGFDEKQRRALMREAKKFGWSFCPRQG